MDPVEITAGRLHLRAWRSDDADAVLAACSDPDVQRWTTVPSPYTAADARAWVGQLSPAAWAAGTGAPFAVLDAVTGALLAGVGLHGIDGRRAEIGYWCARQARGRGVVSEAVGAVCGWAFGALGLQRLDWVAEVGNWPSRAVAEKCGVTVEGVHRRGLLHRGRLVDAWTGSLLADDEVRDRRALPAYAGPGDGVVALRRWRDSDAVDVARAGADPSTARWLPVPVPYTQADASAYVGEAVPRLWADGEVANLAVVDAADGELLGAVGLALRQRVHGIGEVGYWTAPWARGRGVAGRAAALHARWGMAVLGLSRVELYADVDNPASQRAAHKAGFVREGVLRSARPDARQPGRRDMVLFAMTA